MKEVIKTVVLATIVAAVILSGMWVTVAGRRRYNAAKIGRPLLITLTESDPGGWGSAGDIVYRCAEYERLDNGSHTLYDCIWFSNGPVYYEEVYIDGGTRISISK